MLITENVWSNIQCFNLKNKQNIWTVLPVHVWPTCGPRQMFRELHWLKAAEGQAVWRHAQSQKITVTNQTSITYTSPLFGGLCLCWRNAFIKNKKWNSFSFLFCPCGRKLSDWKKIKSCKILEPCWCKSLCCKEDLYF